MTKEMMAKTMKTAATAHEARFVPPPDEEGFAISGGREVIVW